MATPATPSYQIAPPSEMDFSKPEEWAKWIRRFERFRQASGLSTKAETDQVNTLVYSMGDEADDILQSLSLNDEDNATFLFFFFRYCAGQRFIAALSHTGGQARKN